MASGSRRCWPSGRCWWCSWLVVGGIYRGWFTPTEGASVGAAGTAIIALLNGGLTWRSLRRASILATAQATAMIFFIVLGAGVYNAFLALSQVPQELSSFVVAQGFSPWMVLSLILLFYLVFGCLMDSLSMILLTIPIFFPVIIQTGFRHEHGTPGDLVRHPGADRASRSG